MKILVDATFADVPTGMGVMVRNVVTALVEGNERDGAHQLIVYTASRQLLRAQAHRRFARIIDVAGWARRGARVAWSSLLMGMVSHRQHADLYYSPVQYLPCVRNMRQPAVNTIHDLAYLNSNAGFALLSRTLWRLVVPASMHMARKVVCVSEATRQRVIREYGVVPASKLVVVHNGLDPLFLAGVSQERVRAVLTRYRLQEPYILASGGFTRRKNIAALIGAMGLLLQRGQAPPPLVIIGPARGSPPPEIPRELERIPPGNHVRFLGMIPRDDVPVLFKKAALVVLPSLDEGFGLPILEAMAARVPLACSNIDVFLEVGAAIPTYFDPLDQHSIADAILASLTDTGTERLSRGYERSLRFTWRTSAAKLIQLFESLVADTGHSQARKHQPQPEGGWLRT